MKPPNYIFIKLPDDVDVADLGITSGNHWLIILPHSSTLAWEIPWTEEHGRLQPMGSQRVGHD